MIPIQTDSAADAATAFFAALNEQRWLDAARWVEPRWLLRWWHRCFASLCAGLQEREKARLERRDMGSYGSDRILRPELLATYADEVLQFYPARPTLRELAALPPADYLAIILQHTHRRHLRRDDAALLIRYQIISVVEHTPAWQVTFVKGRTDPSLQEPGYQRSGIVDLGKTPDGWRLELTAFDLRRPQFSRTPAPPSKDPGRDNAG